MPEQGTPHTFDEVRPLSSASVYGGAPDGVDATPFVPALDSETGDVIDGNGFRLNAQELAGSTITAASATDNGNGTVDLVLNIQDGAGAETALPAVTIPTSEGGAAAAAAAASEALATARATALAAALGASDGVVTVHSTADLLAAAADPGNAAKLLHNTEDGQAYVVEDDAPVYVETLAQKAVSTLDAASARFGGPGAVLDVADPARPARLAWHADWAAVQAAHPWAAALTEAEAEACGRAAAIDGDGVWVAVLDRPLTFDVTRAGARGDWDGAAGTDDLPAIEAAVAAATALAGPAAARGRRPALLFPEAPGRGYAVSGPVVVPHGIDVVQHSPLVYTGSADGPCLQIGGAATFDWNARHVGLAAARASTSDWSDEGSVGVRLVRLNSSHVDLREARGFTVGLQCDGDGGGFAYNEVRLGEVSDNAVAVELTSGSAGWCNENNFYGGRLTCYSATNPSLDRTGVRITSRDGYYQNNNHFWKPSVELASGTASGAALAIHFVRAQQNGFHGARFEDVDVLYRSENDSQDNEVEAGYDGVSQSVEDLGARVGATVRAQRIGARDGTARALVFDSGPIDRLAAYYQDDGGGAYRVNVPGMHFRSNALASPYSAAGAAIAAPAPESGAAGYVEVPGSLGLAVYVDARRTKRFVVSRDVVAGYGGRVGVGAYDAAGTRLGDTGWVRGHAVTFNPTWISSYGGVYRTGADSDYDVVFEVSDDVAVVEVVATPGSAPLRIRRLQVYAVQPRGFRGLGAPAAWCAAPARGALPGVALVAAAPTWAGRFSGEVVQRQGGPASGVWGWVYSGTGTTWHPLTLGRQAAYVDPSTGTVADVVAALVAAGAMAPS